MSLLDEVQAVTGKVGAKCAICRWLDELPDAEADEWREVFAAPIHVAAHTGIAAVMKQRGHPFSLHQVTNHRKNHARTES